MICASPYAIPQPWTKRLVSQRKQNKQEAIRGIVAMSVQTSAWWRATDKDKRYDGVGHICASMQRMSGMCCHIVNTIESLGRWSCN